MAAMVAALVAALVALLSGCGSDGGGGGGSAPEGEVWQWALGRNIWTDEALQQYSSNVGRELSTDIDRLEDGFKLTFDSSGVVTMVTVFNDETAIGLPGTGNYSAYRGALPGGLSWDATAADLGAEYGTTNQTGGNGTDIVFAYQSEDGYLFDVGFAARHARDLPGSPIHFIQVRRG
jgi:hypothetical protein